MINHHQYFCKHVCNGRKQLRHTKDQLQRINTLLSRYKVKGKEDRTIRGLLTNHGSCSIGGCPTYMQIEHEVRQLEDNVSRLIAGITITFPEKEDRQGIKYELFNLCRGYYPNVARWIERNL